MAEETTIDYDQDAKQLICRGAWDIANLPQLQSLIAKISIPKGETVTINGKDITKLDSAGAWLLCNWAKRMEAQGATIKLAQFSSQAQLLIDLVSDKIKSEVPLPKQTKISWVNHVGMVTVAQYDEFLEYLGFIGELTYDFLRLLNKKTQTRLVAYASVIYQMGYQALFIIAVLSFMIGVVIAYQMGLQLESYGANIYIVDFLGLSMLREFGPLLTAIMVSGRTGAAFTAQIGMMRLNQEVDALDIMGVTPSTILLIPRIIGLVIVLPLLTIWADIFGVVGGMLMTSSMLDITCYDFLQRFPTVVPLKTLFVGLGKTPIFALIIASIGCFQGMRVSGGAASLGENTTRSVVLSIFFILVADAIFSVTFSKLNL